MADEINPEKEQRDFCCIKSCRNSSDIIYYNKGLCKKHWDEYCKIPINELKKKLDITKETFEFPK